LKAVLTSKELDAILDQGQICVEGECTVADVDGLIATLQEQQHNLYGRISEMKDIISSLETLNVADDRDHDEVRETLRAIFRLFAMGDKASGNDYKSTGIATGYSGDVGSGPTDAYKALSPKPWKKTP
jgi:hypothetical protein